MPPQAPPSIKDLLTKAVADSKRLATAQLALAKTEISESGQKIGVGAGLGIATLFILFFVVMFLLISLALVLVQLGFQPWAGFLIITGVLIIAAIITALLARKSLSSIKGPTLAIEEFEKTKAALSEAVAGEPETETVLIERPPLAGL